MPLRPFQRVLNISDFDSGTTDVSISATPIWNKIYTLTVPAQQQIAWGFGTARGNVDTRGQAYLKVWTQARDDASTYPLETGYIHGKIRLAVANANETDVRIVREERTERFSADASDRSKAVLLEETRPRAGEDSKLLIYYYPDDSVAQTLDQDGTNTQLLMPVTVYQ